VSENQGRPYLSIIVPARNEQKRLPRALNQITAYLRQQSFVSELIVVENGSTDNTGQVVERFIAEETDADDPFTVQLMHSAPGKGAAVKQGVLSARGDYLIITDTDLAVPIEEVDKFLPPALPAQNYSIAIASREVPGAIRHGEPVYRHIMGRVFNQLVRWLAVSGIHDTQCGFKSFSREAAQRVFPLQTIDGWGFDVEILYIAQCHDLPIKEIPVNWYYGSDSRVRPVQDTINMVRELLLIRANGRKHLYDRLPAPPVVDELPA
jgi:dolichyl-phosphate beta-glucosyltransferase